MSEAIIPIPALETWALQHRMALVQQAQEILQDAARQVLQRVGAPDGSQIRIEADGSMTAVAPAHTEQE